MRMRLSTDRELRTTNKTANFALKQEAFGVVPRSSKAKFGVEPRRSKAKFGGSSWFVVEPRNSGSNHEPRMSLLRFHRNMRKYFKTLKREGSGDGIELESMVEEINGKVTRGGASKDEVN